MRDTRNLSFHHHKTGAGQLNRGGKVEAVECFLAVT